MLVKDKIDNSTSISPELETELLEMIRNEFPELEIRIINNDQRLLIPRYVFVRYEQNDFLTIYRY